MASQLKTVKAARNDQGECRKCGTPLPAGTGYRYWKPGFRSRVKYKVCTKPECTPKRSELDGSNMSAALEAQEAAHDSVDGAEDFDTVQQAVDDCASSARDLSNEYEDSANEYPMLAEQNAEKQEMLDTWADALEGVQSDEPEVNAEYTRTSEQIAADQEAWDDALEEFKSEARDAIDSLEY